MVKIFPLLLLLFIKGNYIHAQPKPTQSFAVREVVDGDTFWMLNAKGEKEAIRLIGVDAPESKNVFRKKQGYYGKESKQFLVRLLKGKYVRLEYDVGKKDRYGRTLAYVYLNDNTFVNAVLVKQGYAMVLTIPPNVKYAEKFLDLQRYAREHNLGLWALNN